MQFQFNTDNSTDGDVDLEQRIKDEVLPKLKRFESRLTRVEIHLADENGDKGGPDDIRCRIEARPSGADPVTVTANAVSISSAVKEATSKMTSALDSKFGKADRTGA